MTYGLTYENEAAIIEKAKHKKDGCYDFRGVGYRVKNNRVTHFAVDGKILERAYGFNCLVGNYEHTFNQSRSIHLKKITT